MFDYAPPKDFFSVRGINRRGVGQHPHRGFETVTITFQGEVENRDSDGNTGEVHVVHAQLFYNRDKRIFYFRSAPCA